MRVTALHTYTHPPERVILIACLTFTAIGTRQIVAQLAVSTSMQTALTLVHVYKTHESGKETEKKNQWSDNDEIQQPPLSVCLQTASIMAV